MPVLGFLGRYRRLRRHDVVALVVATVTSSASVWLTVQQFAEKAGVLHWALAGTIVVGTSLLVTEGAVQSNTQQSTREREKRALLARSLIEDAFSAAVHLMTNCTDETGGVVYLPSKSDPDLLIPTFTYRKNGKPDEKLSWRRYVGCVGHAWATGKQTFADLSEATDDDLERIWKLSREQIALTRDLKVILATPIFLPSNATEYTRQLVGIVSIDCRVSDAECGLSSQQAQERAKQHALTVAEILLLADLL